MSSECKKPVARSISVCRDGPTEILAMSDAAPWGSDPSGRRGDRSAPRRCLLLLALALGLAVFLACSAAALAVSCLNGMERRLEEKMERRLEEKMERTILKLLAEEERWDGDSLKVRTVYKELLSNPIDTQFHTVKKRHAKPRQKPGKRSNKQKTEKKSHLLNFLHLEGQKQYEPIYDQEKNNAFVWGNTANGIQDNMEAVLAEGGVVQVRIKTRGAYLVYSQVAVKGQSQRRPREPHECAHQTVVDKPSKESRVLLRSLVTQHNYGMKFYGDPDDPDTFYASPIDTKLQMGVFILDPEDLISVHYLKGCEHFNYSLSKDYTYFGVIAMNTFPKQN